LLGDGTGTCCSTSQCRRASRQSHGSRSPPPPTAPGQYEWIFFGWVFKECVYNQDPTAPGQYEWIVCGWVSNMYVNLRSHNAWPVRVDCLWLGVKHVRELGCCECLRDQQLPHIISCNK
jgi:hypothetical protein